MDEVKKWDLQQLPGYEAIEEEKETEATEEPEAIKKKIIYLISMTDLNKIAGYDLFPQNEDELVPFEKSKLDEIIEKGDFNNQNKYEIKIVDPNERMLKVVNKLPVLT